MYAMQGINELSKRLREMTGRDVIDMNRLMGIVQFLYQQRELARRGADYAVDDFGFDAEWTESFLVLFKALYRDYSRGGTTWIGNEPAACRPRVRSEHAGGLRRGGARSRTANVVT